MKCLEISASDLVAALLHISLDEEVCLLDSCGLSNLGSHLLIAGLRPFETNYLDENDPSETLGVLNRKLSDPNCAAFFTISYEFGLKLEGISPRTKSFRTHPEPDVFIALFDVLIVHDYKSAKTFLVGNSARFEEIEEILRANLNKSMRSGPVPDALSITSSNFTKSDYLSAVEKIQAYIRRGDTYQTNLTQQIAVALTDGLSPQIIYQRLRNEHPAAFSAFFRRQNDAVVSISPERFLKVGADPAEPRVVTASPIKGTRPRGATPKEDRQFRRELIQSEKDRAENIMIVDLLRNDLGRVCQYGSVKVEKLCELETHPTLFHLVSTISGELREDIGVGDIIRAVFPCGSITGAPKIRTMELIDEIETADRGLSMGAIGYAAPGADFRLPGSNTILDLSVAIRTMVIRDQKAVFNVGGGIVIDSVPAKEFDESVLKASALLAALNSELDM